MDRFRHIYNHITSLENLLISWQEFLKGKKKRKDVAEFSLHFMDNILGLHQDLKDKIYQHGGYESFSCRINKGTHKAINRFRDFARKVSKNNTKTAWILQCDISKFFANIDHQILKNILMKYIDDADAIWLLEQIIDSFNTRDKIGVGLPLGNLTSQLFVNIYMNEFDQFVKRNLKIKHYIRYADDFVVLSENKQALENILPEIGDFLDARLKLKLNPNKIYIKTLVSGVDFLGYVSFADHQILRTKTKKRMLRKVSKKNLSSYLGLLKHCEGYKLEKRIKERDPSTNARDDNAYMSDSRIRGNDGEFG